MGFQEKVALILTLLTLLQIILVSCSSRDIGPINSIKQKKENDPATNSPILIKLRPHKKGIQSRKRVPDKNYEAIFKKFNFPDIEFPLASAPRPPFHLQETNTLQKNPVQRAAETPTTNVQYPNSIPKKVLNKLAQLKTTKKPGITISFPEISSTPKPYCFREEGAFPDVEYPLSAKEIWKPTYWKHFSSNEPQYQTNNGFDNIPEIGANVRSSFGPLDHVYTKVTSPVTKSKSKKMYPIFEQRVPTSMSINNSQNMANINECAKGIEGNNVITIDINKLTPTTEKIEYPIINKADDQNTTPPPTLSGCTKSTTPFVLTPYTTIYFDKTTSSIDDLSLFNEENEQTTNPSKKKRGKKKRKKMQTEKDDSSTQYKKTTPEDTGRYVKISKPAINNHDKVIPEEPIFKVNSSKIDTCTFISNDKLSRSLPNLYSNTNSTTQSSLVIHKNDKVPIISSDNKVTSISDAVNKIVPNNTDNKGSSCFEDNVINSNKSSACDDKANDSPLSSREDVNVLPSIDEEFTTDVFPDIDENMSPIYTISTSTLSPLSSVEEAWANSDVIDPCKSLSYPDELEEFYIIVPKI